MTLPLDTPAVRFALAGKAPSQTDAKSRLIASRFQKELGYRFANWWPIYMTEEGHKKAFVLIHATDHPEAPKLMRRAFQSIYGAKSGSPTDPQINLPL